VWGRRRESRRGERRERFTPTRVGTTFALKVANEPLAGSPPRVWGRRENLDARARAHRFTPTRVGTTQSDKLLQAVDRVHPHACGDDRPGRPLFVACGGSPPRVWGRRKWARPARRGGRFTPTRVGTTNALLDGVQRASVHPHACGDDAPGSRPCGLRGVHPHACGDDELCQSALISKGGSPPRVWGRPGHEVFSLFRARFTPTRVGTTRRRRRWIGR